MEALIVYPTSCIVGVYNLFIWLFLSILYQQNEPANRELNLCLVARCICTNAICTQILQTPFLINIMIYVECIYRADTAGSCVIFCYIVQLNSFIHRPSEEHAYIQSITRKNYLKVGLLCFCIKICMWDKRNWKSEDMTVGELKYGAQFETNFSRLLAL